MGGSGAQGPAGRPSPLRLGRRMVHGQGEAERGAAARRVAAPDLAAHLLDRAPGDVEPEAHALLRAGEVVTQAGELVEDAVAVARCDALTAVGDGRRDLISLERDLARAVTSETGRVGKEWVRTGESRWGP